MPPKPVQVHLPPFIRRDVGLWFIQVEALFRTSQVTDDQQRYDLTLAALDQIAANEVRELLEDPPETEKFKSLKKALMDRLAVSEESRIRQILANQQIGDRKPSQFLRQLKAKAGADFSIPVLTSIWKEALPLDVQMILAGNPNLDLDHMADMADKIMSVAKPARAIAAVVESENQISALTKQIAALTSKFENHLSRFEKYRESKKSDSGADREYDHPRGQKRERSRSRSRTRKSDSRGFCWYHSRFGKKARKCEQPCEWKDSESDPENSGARQ